MLLELMTGLSPAGDGYGEVDESDGVPTVLVEEVVVASRDAYAEMG